MEFRQIRSRWQSGEAVIFFGLVKFLFGSDFGYRHFFAFKDIDFSRFSWDVKFEALNGENYSDIFSVLRPRAREWPSVWPIKSRQMSIKVAQKWFHSKNESFWHFYKNCLKCGQFGQNDCCHRLWKVAQSAININLVTLPIIRVKMTSECSSELLLFLALY